MKHVDKEEFWLERIEEAKKKKIFYSVYNTSESDWSNILSAHKNILRKECTGKVLDAGCGYGRMSELFIDYVGVDFSKDFIEWAKELYPDKKFIQADLKKLPFKDKEFDCSFCVSIKQMIEANLGKDVWAQMEKELKRVSKKLIILEYTDPEKYETIS